MAPPIAENDLRLLGQLLWRSRQCLEHVEYLLDVQHLLAEAGMDRWLSRVADEVASASAQVADLDREREPILARLAVSLDAPGSLALTLSDLVERAPEPWSEIFSDHLRWFTEQVGRISDAAARSRGSLEEGLNGVHELLRSLKGGGGSGYDHSGRPVVAGVGSSLFFDDRA